MWEKWQRLAYLCRFAHQDIYRLLGRDPTVRPLSSFETRLFERALVDILEREFNIPSSAEGDSPPPPKDDE